MGNSIAASSVISSRLFLQPNALAKNTSEANVAPAAVVDDIQDGEGLIPRFLHQLFARLKETESVGGNQVSVSFLEIYGEEIHDLLRDHGRPNQDEGSQSLQLRESTSGVWVQGLTEVKVLNRKDALEQMRVGSLRRATGSTEMNEHSSRSHAVYTVKIVRRVNRRESLGGNAALSLKASNGISMLNAKRGGNGRRLSFDATSSMDGDVNPDGGAADATIVSKLTFVDLAGSERLKRTQAEGNRMKEGIQINVGLLALGNVINALGDKKSRSSSAQVHVPYRSSKLTRLLQDALGGNSRTLFIACVSPAEANSNETLNTLQYANRAKNIQNKAIKNIDSRSAELLSLKALNELLRRELIKARFMQANGVDPSQIEAMVDLMLKDPAVQGYLKRLEQIAMSSGVEAFGSDVETHTENDQAVLSRLSAQLSRMVSERLGGIDNGHHDQVPCERRDFIGSDDFNTASDERLSVVDMKSKFCDEQEEVEPFSLLQLCRTLEIISLSLEIQCKNDRSAQIRSSIDARIAQHDAEIHRKEVVAAALEAAIAKMASWASSAEGEQAVEQAKHMATGRAKLESVKREILKLTDDKRAHQQQLQECNSRVQKQIKAAQDKLVQLREACEHLPCDLATNPLDVLIHSSEIKNRFHIPDLTDVSNYLLDGERAVADYLEGESDAIAHMPALFIGKDAPTTSSRDIFLNLRNELQNTLDDEDLRASLSSELRHRAQILQDITNGWMERQSRDETSSESDFLSMNEEKLTQCEENIRYLSETVRSRSKQEQQLRSMVESIPSLDTSKNVVKRLLQELYSQKRLFLANSADTDDQCERVSSAPLFQPLRRLSLSLSEGLVAGEVSTDANEIDLRSKMERLVEEHEKEMIATFEMVSNFSDTKCDSQQSKSEGQLAFWAQKCAAADSKMSLLEAKQRDLQAQLAAKDKDAEDLRSRVSELEANLQTSKVKEEALLLLDRCQEIWGELGLNAEDQAGKFKDINALLLKKCSEELEGLESAREKLQARIDAAYKSVKKLEDILSVKEPIDLKVLHSVAGKTLLAQEKYLLTAQKNLEDELCQRFQARVRGLQKIRDLLQSMGLNSLQELRHASVEECKIDSSQLLMPIQQLDAWEDFEQVTAQSVLSLLTVSQETDVTASALKHDEHVLSVLLKEKTRRFVEVEDQLQGIRSLLQQLKFTEEEIVHVLRKSESSESDAAQRESGKLKDVMLWILQKGGSIDVSSKTLNFLSRIRRNLDEIYDGRSNAISYLYSTLAESVVLAKEILGGASDEDTRSLIGGQSQAPADGSDYGCDRHELMVGKRRLEELGGPIESSLRALLLSMDDEFMAFGIETDAQRISFFLGSDDDENNATRKTLERYILGSSGADSSMPERCSTRQSSFLSDLDPAFDEFSVVYSADFGKLKLERMKDSFHDVDVVQNTLQSAQKRLDSLKKIMKLFNEISEFKKKIGQFEANASKKDRLFGSSLRLLEEEKFRKMAAKRYPNLLAVLRKEVEKWLQNGEGEFDPSILGNDLKNLLLDMMNTDTGLMHLDLGMVDATRMTARRQSKTSQTPTPGSSQPTSTTAGNQNASAPARSRSMTVMAKDSSAKKRLAFEH